MELHTLFRRESAAEPFFIRIKYMLPSSVPIIISVVSSVPVQGAKSGELESRFIRNCRLKNGSALKEKIMSSPNKGKYTIFHRLQWHTITAKGD
jgi:hypothetical protein